jgi:hypothetical protein
MIKSRRMRQTEYVACMVRRPEGKRPYGKSKNIWKASIKMDLKVTGCEGVDYINLSMYKSSGGLF